MTAVVSPIKFTYEDYLTFPNDGKRHELIEGEHTMSPAPNIKHQSLSIILATAIKNYLDIKPIGRVFHAPIDVVLNELNVVQPDLVFISNAKINLITEANIQGAPDLLVEILSPSTRKTDEVIKRKLYDRFAVTEYWVVDPELDAIKIYRRDETGFARVAELSLEQQDDLTTPLLPGWVLSLQKLFS